jgi:hypothetical protein
MNKFIPDDVHDSKMEFHGRKAKPSNKMRFKTTHSGAIYRRDVYLRDKGFQPAAKPASDVMSQVTCLDDR